MILMLVQDSEDPYGIVKRLMDAAPSGSYLAISHPAGDVDTGEIAEAYERLNERMGATQGTLRSHEGVARFFDGLEMVEPGLVQLHRWRPEPGAPGLEFDVPAYAGVGRKPWTVPPLRTAGAWGGLPRPSAKTCSAWSSPGDPARCPVAIASRTTASSRSRCSIPARGRCR
jgi:S-adenosyl methyltransferase